MMRREPTAGNHDWLSLVRTSGLVVSLPVLNAALPEGPEPVDDRMQRKFDRAWQRFNVGLERQRSDAQSRWLDFILDELLGLQGRWIRQHDVPESATHMLIDYQQVLRPQRMLVDDNGDALLLVSIVPPHQKLDAKETHTGTWRASPFHKLDRLLGETGVRFGLLTNGHEFRLVLAPPGLGAAYISWQARDWADEKIQLDSFHALLHAERFYGDEKKRLQKLVEDSQDKQLELTDQLGDQVRQALEVFLRAVDHYDREHGGEILRGMEHQNAYEMCLFTMMRLVFMLYAEENYLLPHGEVLYDQAYGVTHLWKQLSDQRREAPEALAHTFDAYPQLLATFRLIHQGCIHPDLNLLPYGGHLFNPERFPALEDSRLLINNQVMYLVLQKLLFAQARTAGRTEMHRLSYSALDIEQIGTVYEGLLGYTVRRIPADETSVVFQGKHDSMRPLDELESQTPDDLPDYIRQQTGWTEKQAEKALERLEQESSEVPPPPPGIDSDLYQRLLKFRSFLKLDETIPGGHLYVAHESGLRKGQGVYYTPKWITSCIVERTLEPLVYQPSEGTQGDLKSPREILDLKVCDPAMGSGAFLVQACRYLADKLVESWDRLAAENPESKVTLPYGELSQDEPGEIILPEHHEEAVVWARRFVAEHCLYGVDINPLAVELAKMSLWLITLAKDRPFEFLDHKLRPGDSLIGCRGDELGDYPVKAWGRKVEGDKQTQDAIKELAKVARQQAKRRRSERDTGVLTLLDEKLQQKLAETAEELRRIEDMDTLDPGAKEAAFIRLIEEDEDWQHLKQAFDAWCALWFWPVGGETQAEDVPMPRDYPELLEYLLGEDSGMRTLPEERLARWADQIETLWRKHHFFHWELEFPDACAGEDPGFDAMVMNPPWERIKLQENEFFAVRDPDIAGAPNAAARKKLIAALPDTKPWLHDAHLDAKGRADFTSHFIRESGHFPLSAVGDINTYPIFAEHARSSINTLGGVGMVIPSGIATDYYTQDFFADLMETGTLRALYDFENRERAFPDLDARTKFTLLFLAHGAPVTDFAFFLTRRQDLGDEARHVALSDEDIALLNPNTRTCPIFRSKRDAQLTKRIYRRHPVLIREIYDDDGNKVGEENPWGITFATMFHMTNDSDLFRPREELESDGFTLRQPGNHFVKGEDVWLPLYEGRMLWLFDHRYVSMQVADGRTYRTADSAPTRQAEHCSSCHSALPRYWVAEAEYRAALPSIDVRPWHFAFRDVTNPVTERTVVGAVIPAMPAGNKAPFILFGVRPRIATLLVANILSFPFDYCARQKLSYLGLNFFIMKQLPVLRPDEYDHDHLDHIADRVLELTYTAWDIKAFAGDLGYDGPPFVWDEERRAQLRAQLDALYFHLYGIERDDVDHIMETFPIVKRKDIAAHGHYHTKDLILSYYDDQAAGDFTTWHGPEELKEPMIHPDDSRP